MKINKKLFVLTSALMLVNPLSVYAANNNVTEISMPENEQQQPVVNSTENTESGNDDTYTGDDTYYLDEGQSSTEQSTEKDYYKQSGTPYQQGEGNVTKYAKMDNSVIIDSLDTEINVNENNKYDVTKKVKIYYNTEKDHKVVLEIPLNNLLSTSSDEVENVQLQSSIEGTNYKTNMTANAYDITITDATEGCVCTDYTISYTYVSKGDDDSSCDKLTQNLLGFKDGEGNAAPTFKLNFKVKMPKEYKQNELLFQNSNGDTVNVNSSTDGLSIIGYCENELDDNVLNINLSIQNKYFHSTASSGLLKFFLSFISLICGLIIIAGFGLAGYSYYKYGMDKKPTIIPQKKPIKGLSSVDIIVAMTGGATNEDLLLYILELANQGYIKIKDKTHAHDKKRDVTKGYVFIKVKDYDGQDKYMKRFMNILFRNKNFVTAADLSKKTYSKLDALRLIIQDKGIAKLWEIDDDQRKICANIGLLVPLLVSLFLSLYSIDVGISLKTFSFLYGPIMTILIYKGINYVDKQIKKRNVMRGGVADAMTWIYVIGSAIVILLIAGSLNTSMFVKHSFMMTVAYFAEIALIYCSCNMKKRTEEGLETCGRILGFREFLLTATEVDLKRAILKDEQYAYKTLPMAIALNVATEGWLSQMDGCFIDNPTWYISESDAEFKMIDFMKDWTIIKEKILEEADD